MVDRLQDLLRVLVVTDRALLAGRDLVAVCRAAVRGGATSIELRDKTAPAHDLYALAIELVHAVPVPVLVNDRLDVALAAAAAGCHLGVDDLPATVARRLVPPNFVLGVSVGSPEEAGLMRPARASYWGIGPCYPTTTKPDAGKALGPAGFADLQRLAESTPCIGIGGISEQNAAAIIHAGAAGVAVSSAIMGCANPAEAAARLRRAVDGAFRASA